MLAKPPHITAAHAQTDHLIQTIFYPEHGPERQNPTYHATHHKLIYEMDEGCWVCGVSHSTLGDPEKNPHGATQLETHHGKVEDALGNSIDPAKIIEDFPEAKDFRTWLDSEGNMLVLCDVHHRHGLYGIHSITYPPWQSQRWQFKGWDLATGPAK